MNPINPINTALSGLRANERALVAHAQNVANVNTDGYRAIEATMEADSSGGVDVHLKRGPEPEPGLSGVDLNEEAVDIVALEAGYKANVAVVRRADEMTGNLLDIVG